MQNNRVKQYANDDIDIAKRQKEEEIYERLFKKKVKEQINRFFPTQQHKERFLDQYCMVYGHDDWPLGNRDVEANFNRCIDVFTTMSFKYGPFKSFFDFVNGATAHIAFLQAQRNTIHNNFANYLLNNHGNEINNAIQQAQQNMENRLRDEEARFLNDQRIKYNQALQNARNEVENRAEVFFKNQECQFQNQINQIQNKATQLLNNERRKYLDVKHKLSNENDKLKAYNKILKEENTKMKCLLKSNNYNYIYNRQNFENLSRSNSVVNKINEQNYSKSVFQAND